MIRRGQLTRKQLTCEVWSGLATQEKCTVLTMSVFRVVLARYITREKGVPWALAETGRPDLQNRRPRIALLLEPLHIPQPAASGQVDSLRERAFRCEGTMEVPSIEDLVYGTERVNPGSMSNGSCRRKS
jgi:hypothetical protein